MGSIPAWAGETGGRISRPPLSRVYPRVGGGNKSRAGDEDDVAGLSPRGRGKHTQAHRRAERRRSIPAWAGETSFWLLRTPPPVVYPRVGGGNTASATICNCIRGLSPRGRGKPRLRGRKPRLPWSIPAWAGETRLCAQMPYSTTVYPRVGGGNGVAADKTDRGYGLSPRGRGKRQSAASARRRNGSIPAWAGETCEPNACCPCCEVYPRVGGGNHRAPA